MELKQISSRKKNLQRTLLIELYGIETENRAQIRECQGIF